MKKKTSSEYQKLYVERERERVCTQLYTVVTAVVVREKAQSLAEYNQKRKKYEPWRYGRQNKQKRPHF